MAPQTETEPVIHIDAPSEKPLPSRKYDIIYRAVVGFAYVHLAALYGVYLLTVATWYTIVFCAFTSIAAGIGITAGAHRLWSHRAYKAKLPLQILLIMMQSISFEYSVLTWVKLHRVHHRYCDTDADPHNSSRGFFFSHIGWMMVRTHPEARRRLKEVDLPDIYANPLLMFQHKYTTLFGVIFCFLLPTAVPLLWGEALTVAWHLSVLRFVYTFHCSFLINSFAHILGSHTYDKSIRPTQNPFVSLLIHGEGFHNYHHTFPWDYRAAELGNNWLNLSTHFIDFFAWVGWAYDLKTVPEDVIAARSARTGDGSSSWGVRAKSS